MRKLSSLLIVALAFLQVNAQTFTTKEPIKADYFLTAGGYHDLTIHFENLTQEPLVLAYEKVYVDFPAAWGFQLCDNRNCFTGFIDGDTFTAIQPGDETSSLKLTVYPQNVLDTGIVSYKIYNKYKPEDVDTIEYRIYVVWNASTPEVRIESNSKVYPNPVSNNLTVSNSFATQSYSVFSNTGQLINEEILIGGKEIFTIDCTDMKDDVYYLQMITENGLRRKQFVVSHN
jgi:hypothetical protein